MRTNHRYLFMSEYGEFPPDHQLVFATTVADVIAEWDRYAECSDNPPTLRWSELSPSVRAGILKEVSEHEVDLWQLFARLWY